MRKPCKSNGHLILYKRPQLVVFKKALPTYDCCGALGIVMGSQLRYIPAVADRICRYLLVVVKEHQRHFFCCRPEDVEFVDFFDKKSPLPKFNLESPKQVLRTVLNAMLNEKYEEAKEDIVRAEDIRTFDVLEAIAHPQTSVEFRFNGQIYWLRWNPSMADSHLRLYKKCKCCGETRSVHVEEAFASSKKVREEAR